MCLSAAVMGDVTHVRLSIVTASLLMFALNSAGSSFEAAIYATSIFIRSLLTFVYCRPVELLTSLPALYGVVPQENGQLSWTPPGEPWSKPLTMTAFRNSAT